MPPWSTMQNSLGQTSLKLHLLPLSNNRILLQLLQDRAEAFKEYHEGNRKLIDSLSLAVKVIHAFSGIIGYAVNHVSRTCQCYLVILVTVTSSDPISTSKSFACWN